MKTDHCHLADDQLIALYFGDEQAGDDSRRTVRQRLHGCEACTWRYTELTAPLERLRRDAASEADEVFTPARLEAQRVKIIERLDEAAHGSRVIPFPASSARLDRSVVRRPLARWVAAAAAAGLLLGVMAGRLFDNGSGTFGPSRPVTQTAGTAVAPSVTIATPVSLTDGPEQSMTAEGDEAMLGEIDQAVYRQRIAALSALDELTPRLRQDAVLARVIR